jgi:hypothetical protein
LFHSAIEGELKKKLVEWEAHIVANSIKFEETTEMVTIVVSKTLDYPTEET